MVQVVSISGSYGTFYGFTCIKALVRLSASAGTVHSVTDLTCLLVCEAFKTDRGNSYSWGTPPSVRVLTRRADFSVKLQRGEYVAGIFGRAGGSLNKIGFYVGGGEAVKESLSTRLSFMEERGIQNDEGDPPLGQDEAVALPGLNPSPADDEASHFHGSYERTLQAATARLECMRNEGDLFQIKALKVVIEASKLARELNIKEKTEKKRFLRTSLPFHDSRSSNAADQDEERGAVASAVNDFIRDKRVSASIEEHAAAGSAPSYGFRASPSTDDIFSAAIDSLQDDSLQDDTVPIGEREEYPLSPATASKAFASTPHSSPTGKKEIRANLDLDTVPEVGRHEPGPSAKPGSQATLAEVMPPPAGAAEKKEPTRPEKVWSKVSAPIKPFDLPNKCQAGTNVLTGDYRRVEREPGSASYRWPIDTDLFEGETLLVFRDTVNEKRGGNGKYQKLIWEGKSRLFVFQTQGRFKRQPRGPIHMQISVCDDTATMGMFSKRFAKIVGSFAASAIPKAELQMSLKPLPGKPMGVAMKVDPSWISILKEKGDKVWQLGERMPTYKECLARNGCDVGAFERVDLEATYTLEYYTANVDAIQWQLTGIAVMPNMTLDNFCPEFPHIKKATAAMCTFRERVDENEDFYVKPKRGSVFGGALLVNKP